MKVEEVFNNLKPEYRELIVKVGNRLNPESEEDKCFIEALITLYYLEQKEGFLSKLIKEIGEEWINYEKEKLKAKKLSPPKTISVWNVKIR